MTDRAPGRAGRASVRLGLRCPPWIRRTGYGFGEMYAQAQQSSSSGRWRVDHWLFLLPWLPLHLHWWRVQDDMPEPVRCWWWREAQR